MIVDEAVYVLDHSGVKGMKWGQRRSRNRQLNKASAKKDWAKQERDVSKAREKVKSGQLKVDRHKAKAQFKQDKIDLGSREAKKILAKKNEKINSTFMVAQQAKNKKETALILTAVGAITVLNVARIAAAAKRL